MSSFLIIGRSTHNYSSISISKSRKLLFNTLAINFRFNSSIPINNTFYIPINNKYANLQSRLLSSPTASIDTVLKKNINPPLINKKLNPISIANLNNEILNDNENNNRNTANTYTVNQIAEIFIERMTKVEASFFIRMIKIMNEKDHDYIMIYGAMNTKTKKENRWMGQWVWSMIQKDLSNNLHPNSIDIISDIDSTKYKMDIHDNFNYNDVHNNLKDALLAIQNFDNFLDELGEGDSLSLPKSQNSFLLLKQMKLRKDYFHKINNGVGDVDNVDVIGVNNKESSRVVALTTHICNTVSLKVANDITEIIKMISKEEIKGEKVVRELKKLFDMHTRSLYSLLDYLSIRMNKYTELHISLGQKNRLELIESLTSELKQCLTIGKWSVANKKNERTQESFKDLNSVDLKKKKKELELNRVELESNIQVEYRKIKSVDDDGNEIENINNDSNINNNLLIRSNPDPMCLEKEKTSRHIRKFGSKHTHYMVIKCFSDENGNDYKYSEYNSNRNINNYDNNYINNYDNNYINNYDDYDNNNSNNNNIFDHLDNNNNNKIVEEEEEEDSSTKFKIFVDNIHEEATTQDVAQAFKNCGQINKIWYFQSFPNLQASSKYTNLQDNSVTKVLSSGAVVHVQENFSIIDNNNNNNSNSLKKISNSIDDNNVDKDRIINNSENNIINLITPITTGDEPRHPLATLSAIKTRKQRTKKADMSKKIEEEKKNKKKEKKKLSSLKVQRSSKSDGFAFIEVADENCLSKVTSDELRIFGLNIKSKNCKIIKSKNLKTLYIELLSSMSSEMVINLLSSVLGYGLEFNVAKRRKKGENFNDSLSDVIDDLRPCFIHLECDNHNNAWKIFQHLKQANLNGLPLKPSWVKSNWYYTVGNKAREMNLDKINIGSDDDVTDFDTLNISEHSDN